MRAMAKKKPKPHSNVIARNKRAGFDYQLLETFEAGIALNGWEVKSLRMGKADLADSYVLMKNGEAWLLGALITPLDTASTHFITDPQRTRKLLLHKKELAKILAATPNTILPAMAQAPSKAAHYPGERQAVVSQRITGQQLRSTRSNQGVAETAFQYHI